MANCGLHRQWCVYVGGGGGGELGCSYKYKLKYDNNCLT